MSDDSKKESVDQKAMLFKFSENRNMPRVACFAEKIFTCAFSKRKTPPAVRGLVDIRFLISKKNPTREVGLVEGTN